MELRFKNGKNSLVSPFQWQHMESRPPERNYAFQITFVLNHLSMFTALGKLVNYLERS
jgi:hypothetical protein